MGGRWEARRRYGDYENKAVHPPSCKHMREIEKVPQLSVPSGQKKKNTQGGLQKTNVRNKMAKRLVGVGGAWKPLCPQRVTLKLRAGTPSQGLGEKTRWKGVKDQVEGSFGKTE